MGAKEVVIGSISWVFLILLLAVPILVLSVYKLILTLIIKCFRRDLVLLSGLDVMQCPGNSHEKSIVNFGCVLHVKSSAIKVEQLRELWKDKFLGNDLQGLLGYENLSLCVETFGGYSFGKRVKIDSLEKLIHERNVDDGKCLEEVVAEWLLEKYSKDSPCWELILVPLESANETAVAFKIHHAFADGYSVLHILDKLTENQSPYLVKDFESNCIQQGLTLLQVPSHMDKMKGDSQLNILECKKEQTPKWIVSFATLDLKVLKRIRQIHKVHLASVIMSLVGGALKKYSLEMGIVEEDKVPVNFPMGSTVAWPRHPTKVFKSYPKLCNHWATMLFRVSTKDDPVQRLLETEKSYKANLECGITHLGFKFLFPLIGMFPLSIRNKMFGEDMGTVGGYSVSVGGDNYKLLGNEITRINSVIALFDVIPTLPISILSFSHSDKMEITIGGNPQRFPDRKAVEKVAVHIAEELERLRSSSLDQF